MKTIRSIGLMFALGLFIMSGASLQAQDNKDAKVDKKAEQEAEMKARKEMLEQQRQEMKEQEALMKLHELQFEEQSDLIEARVRDATREAARARVYIPSSGDHDFTYFFSPEDRNNSSQLTLRNSYSGGSDSSTGDFDVDEGTRQFRCMISGRVREGEISIKVMYPGGKVFKDLTINSSAEVTFSQTLSIKEDADDKYIGSWSYEIKAKEAEGDYTLSISAN